MVPWQVPGNGYIAFASTGKRRAPHLPHISTPLLLAHPNYEEVRRRRRYGSPLRCSHARPLRVGGYEHYDRQLHRAIQATNPLLTPNGKRINCVVKQDILLRLLQNFMNDPNGLFQDAEGTYHMYYQCTLACLSYAVPSLTFRNLLR